MVMRIMMLTMATVVRPERRQPRYDSIVMLIIELVRPVRHQPCKHRDSMHYAWNDKAGDENCMDDEVRKMMAMRPDRRQIQRCCNSTQ